MRTTLPLLLLLAATTAVSAQEAAVPQIPAAPITRVARLAWFDGDLQIQRVDNTAPVATPGNPNPDSAALNMPIPEGSRLVTGKDAEAEIEFEDGSVARLTPDTALSVDAMTLAGKTVDTQLSLLGGLAYFELRHASTAVYTIAAGTLLASPADNSIFRIELNQPPALVSVLSGALNISSDTDQGDGTLGGFSATVKAGESLHADPDGSARYFLNPQIADNSWDSWNQARDTGAASEATTRTTARDPYAGSQGYGWSDLDANGTWYAVPNANGTSSEVWQPTIAASATPDAAVGPTPDATPGAAGTGATDGSTDSDAFDPYGDGAFVFTGGAYLWASGYTWGWLPYRCGRWNYYTQFGWTWAPDRFCRTYGFGGAGTFGGVGGINIGRHPQDYRILQVPPPSPAHPVLRVHTADPRPLGPGRARERALPVKLDGATATPLERFAAAAIPVDGSAGGALYRDYPVQPETLQPLLGSIAPPVTEPTVAAGWIAPHPSRNAPHRVRTAALASHPRPAAPARAPAPKAAAAPSKPK